MALHDNGTPAVNSSSALIANPTTNALLAEISSLAGGQYEVRWIVGATTNATWKLEHCLSSGITSTSFRDQVIAFTATNQSAEYVGNYTVETGDRLRARLESSFTGSAAAHIQIEQLT